MPCGVSTMGCVPATAYYSSATARHVSVTSYDSSATTRHVPSRATAVPLQSVTFRHGPSRSVMVRHGPPRSATVRRGPPRRTEIRHGVPRTATARRGPLWLATGYVHMSGEMMTATPRDGQRSSALTSRDGVPSRRSVTGFRHVGCHI
jgi:hypothetical protein